MSDTARGDERLREAFAALSREVATAPGCPEPDLLWSALAGEAAPAEVERVVDHTTACPACAEAWRLGRELRESASLSTEAPPDTVPSTGGGWGWGALAAGLAAVALAAGALLMVGTPESGYREGGSPTIRSEMAEGAELPRAAFVLRWTPGPAGTRYSVLVTTEGLDTLARARGLETAEYRVPETALSGVEPGSRILWRVEGVLPDGSRSSSATFVSRLE